MVFKKLFDTAVVDAFASWVGTELAKSCPPDGLQDASKAAVKRLEQFDARVRRQVAQVLVPAKLNLYQKAKLGSKLQDVLEAAGYPAEFREQLSYDVVRLVAMSTARPL